MKGSNEAVFKVQTQEAKIEILNLDAQVKSCTPWKEFPHLFVAEIDLGTSGTISEMTETDLFIFDMSQQNISLVFQKEIESSSTTYTSSSKVKSTETLKVSYQLRKTEDGKPALSFSDSQNMIPIGSFQK